MCCVGDHINPVPRWIARKNEAVYRVVDRRTRRTLGGNIVCAVANGAETVAVKLVVAEAVPALPLREIVYVFAASAADATKVISAPPVGTLREKLLLSLIQAEAYPV